MQKTLSERGFARVHLDGTGRLEGKVALITGAASGIGAAIALAFARAGAQVALNYLHREREANETLARIERDGGRCMLVHGDVCREADIAAMFEAVSREFSVPAILVNDAGVDALGKQVADLSLDEWEEALRTNSTGPFLCSRAFIQGLRANGRRGKIINISSVHEELPRAGAAEYCASKGALRNLTRCLALELAPDHINVNGIAPGMIFTPMNQADIDDRYKRKADEATIPWKRGGNPEEVARLALFLASADADYVTGSTYVIDGGLMQNTGQGA